MKEKKLPTSRLGRLARMAALGTRATTGKLASVLGSKEAEARLAQTAADALGTMRGLALKMGQMASYVDGMVPDEHRDTYEEAMRKLRAAAPTMSAGAAARVLRQELGAEPDELFASFTPEPFAAASIGQVHRARTRAGDDVAVKIQFEGIHHAVHADLDNASLFSALLGPIGSKFQLKEQMVEVRARFLEELDYGHEATRQQRFAAVFARHDTVRIPRVFADRSTRRVLTTAFAPGMAFDAARGEDAGSRHDWAVTLWRFVFESLLRHGLFNADPHPGNYLFERGGVVHFLDFGCTRELSLRHLELVRAAHRAASTGNLPGLYEAAEEMLELPRSGPSVPLARDYIKLCFQPIWSERPFHITRDWAASLMHGMRDNALAMLRGSRKDFKALPAEWIFFNRLQLGFYSVLARLDVAVDYRAVDGAIVASLDSGA